MSQATQSPRKNKSGSNNRKRQVLLGTRLTSDEMALVQAAAERSNTSVASFVRSQVLRAAS